MPRAITGSGDRSHAGARKYWVTIERLIEGLSGSNYPTEKFGQPSNVWAGREYVTLDEQFVNSQTAATAIERWNIPYHAEMDPDTVDVPKTRRLTYRGRVRNIISAELDESQNGRAIILTTKSAVDGAA